MKKTRHSLVRALALVVLLFTACKTALVPAAVQNTAAPVTASAVPSAIVETQDLASLPEPSEPSPSPTNMTVIKSPRATVTAMVVSTTTPAPAAALTLSPGLQIFANAEIPEFVFPADPARWKPDPNSGYPWAFLVHTRLPGCSISAVPGRGIGTPLRVLRWQLGRLYWVVLDNGNNALASLDKPANLFLDLIGLDNAECRADQQAVMAQVMLADELSGKAAFDPLPTATPRPPLAGFDCPNTPPVRLRPGDSAHIVTDDLWLRSEPRPTDDTEVKTYDHTAPVMIHVLEGPLCGGKFVYWKVSVSLIGEGVPEPVTGWFAEGDLKEYYLAPGF